MRALNYQANGAQGEWGALPRLVAAAGWLGALVLGTVGIAAWGAPPVTAVSEPAVGHSGEAVWKERCASCHDNPNERIPPRPVVAIKTFQAVRFALTRGVMKPQAAGLTAQQITDVSAYITRRGPGQSGAVDEEIDINANKCRHPAPPMRLGAGDWNGWGVDHLNSRFNSQPGLSAAQVPTLKLKWAFAYPLSQGLQPTLAGGRLFVASRSGHLFSLDPKTGCTYWALELAAMPRGGIIVQPIRGRGRTRFGAFFSIENNQTMALDAETGKELWTTPLQEHPLQHITGAAAYHRGRIYQGIASQEEVAIRDVKYPCCTISGTVVAIDAGSGRLVWKNTTIPDPPKAIGTSTAGTVMYGPAGAGVWATPAIDAKRNAVYVGTGNSNTPISVTASNAIIGFDLATGRRLWTTQLVEGDNVCPKGWTGPGYCNLREYDITGGVILQELPNAKRVILAGTKGGVVYALDPDANGKLLWQKQVHPPSGYGGSWGFAIDGQRLYVNTPNLNPRAGGPMPGGIAALDPATGEQIWYAKPVPAKCSWSTEETLKRPMDCTSSQQAGLAAMPGVLFAGSVDGHARAYDTATGQVIWDFDTAGERPAVNGAIARGGSLSYGTFAVGYGMLFVDSGAPGLHEGNSLLAFGLDGQ